MSPNWLNVAGCDVLSTEGVKVSTLFDIRQHKRYFTDYGNQNKSYQKMPKFQLCLILDNTKDILQITGTKTNHPKKWGWLVEEETEFPTNTRQCNGKAPIVHNLK